MFHFHLFHQWTNLIWFFSPGDKKRYKTVAFSVDDAAGKGLDQGWEGQFGSVCGSTLDLPHIFRITCLLSSCNMSRVWNQDAKRPHAQNGALDMNPFRSRLSFLGNLPSLIDSLHLCNDLYEFFSSIILYSIFHFHHLGNIFHHLCECAILAMWWIQRGRKMILRHRILKAQPMLAY